MNTMIPDRLFFKIGDVAELVGVKPYVLRYWESEFALVSPQKSHAGQRLYRKSDVESLLMIKHLLYNERYSIEGARNRINELRKNGKLRDFKVESTHGTKSVAQEIDELRDRQKKLQKAAVDIEKIARTPVHELFKF